MKRPRIPRISKKLLIITVPIATFMLGATAALYAAQSSYSYKHPYSDDQVQKIVVGEYSSANYQTSINIDEIYDLVNQERTKAGLKPLTRNARLDASAKAKCLHMVENGYWSHYAPDGTPPWLFITKQGYGYSTAGENLAKDFATSSGIVRGWMSSQGHKDNILNTQFTESGMAGCNTTENETTISIVQHFAKPL